MTHAKASEYVKIRHAFKDINEIEIKKIYDESQKFDYKYITHKIYNVKNENVKNKYHYQIKILFEKDGILYFSWFDKYVNNYNFIFTSLVFSVYNKFSKKHVENNIYTLQSLPFIIKVCKKSFRNDDELLYLKYVEKPKKDYNACNGS